jgi:hypothetical protein
MIDPITFYFYKKIMIFKFIETEWNHVCKYSFQCSLSYVSYEYYGVYSFFSGLGISFFSFVNDYGVFS